ncbi:hypothetical protein C8R43DRAFT_1122072 [Mycena crocata]|nr:hypothetical protein C8R43DRAFT_1122072 [Mycena crocata]
MSTTDPTPTGLPAESSSPPSSSNQLTSGTNYFFGFLIAFIAFLFVFLSLGLLARRRRIRLMQEFLLYGPDDDHSPASSQTEPLMWQPVYADAERPVWSDIMPLSTTLLRREVIEEKAPSEVLPPRPTRNPFVVYFGFPAMKPRRRPALRKTQVTEGMNIAVMITMPMSPGTLADDEPPECQIGTMQIPWTDETLEAPISDESDDGVPRASDV